MRATVAMTSLAALLALSGCAETKFLDAVGAGKYVPDETQVHQNANLAMPPDLQLRPPGNGPADDLQPNVAQAPAASALPPAAPAAPAAPVKTAAATAPAPAPAAPAVAAVPAPAVPQDPYAKYGISRTLPDGKPKPQSQLDEELRQAVLAEKRKANPNYGTIFNIGSLFSNW